MYDNTIYTVRKINKATITLVEREKPLHVNSESVVVFNEQEKSNESYLSLSQENFGIISQTIDEYANSKGIDVESFSKHYKMYKDVRRAMRYAKDIYRERHK